MIAPPGNREWGILENLQLLILMCIFGLVFFAARKNTLKIFKWGYGLLAVFTLFIILEEMDYGTHFYQLWEGLPEEESSYDVKSLHNLGNNAKLFKRSIYVLMGALFVISPFLKEKVKHPFLRYLIPKPRILLVAVLAIISDLVPRLIIHYDIREDGGLGINIGEFSEIMVYYIFMIYLIHLIFGPPYQNSNTGNSAKVILDS